MSNELNKNIRLLNAYSDLDERYGTYPNVEVANNSIAQSVRKPGLTVGIEQDQKVTEYWYYGGVEDIHLIPKIAPGQGANSTEDVLTTLDVGASEAYTIIPEGISFTDYIKLVHQKSFNPTFTNESFSLSRSGSNLRTVGSLSNFNITFNFNRGQILGNIVNGAWVTSAVQNFKLGEALLYTLDGIQQSSNVLAINNYEVELGINEFEGFVQYAEGPQPLNSEGQNFGDPFSAGTSPVRTASFEGVYPLFASSSSITTSSQQPLFSLLNGNNFEINLVAETGGNKQFFELPTVLVNNRPLQSVQYFNTVSNQFDTTNQIGNFSTSNIVKNIEGNSIQYKKYTHNGANRGSILIKLIF